MFMYNKDFKEGDRMNRTMHTTIKMALAMVFAYSLAELLMLEQTLAAGILAVLSVQSTRTDSFALALKRLLDALFALTLGTTFFLLFGFTAWIFVVFAAVFIAGSFIFKIEAGIVPSLVLASHVLAPGAFDLNVLLNSVLLMIVAVSVALALGLIYPMRSQQVLSRYAIELDALVKQALQSVVEGLKLTTPPEDRQKTLQEARNRFRNLRAVATEADKDLLFDKNHRLMHYLRMRDMQMRRVRRLHELLDHLESNHPHALTLAHYIEALIPDIGAVDKATAQLKRLHNLLEDYRQKPLPSSRQAFESRAILFQMVYELQAFLQAKIEYHTHYDPLSTQKVKDTS